MLPELHEVLNTLHDVHDQMKQRMMLNKDFRALIAVEKSIALLSHFVAPDFAPPPPTVDDHAAVDFADASTLEFGRVKFGVPRPTTPN
jgi:hypothetical protein